MRLYGSAVPPQRLGRWLTWLLVVGFGLAAWGSQVEARPRSRRVAHAGFDTRKLSGAQDNKRARRSRRRRFRRPSCRVMLRRRTALRYLKRHRRLELAVRHYLKDLHRCKILRRYDHARMLVYDYRGCKLVALRQYSRTSAASLIKPFVMLGVYHRARRRGIRATRFSRRLQRHVNRMMRVSNNYSTNYLIRSYLGRGSARRGLRYINRLLPHYSIRRTRLVETIPRGGRTYRNYTTARDLSILLYRIYHKRAVSRSFSRKMLSVMRYSRDNRGKTPYLRHHYHIRAATKTGYTRRTNGVAGIILRGNGLRRRVYNFVAIITRPLVRANEWTWRRTSTKLIQRLSEMTYHHYLRGYADREVRRYRKTRICRR